MKKSTALKEIDALIKNFEDDLEKVSKILPKAVKHKHMFNDINYCLSNIQSNMDMLLELKEEINKSGKEKDADKVEAFKLYSMECPAEEVVYDFDWDKEDAKEEDDD